MVELPRNKSTGQIVGVVRPRTALHRGHGTACACPGRAYGGRGRLRTPCVAVRIVGGARSSAEARAPGTLEAAFRSLGGSRTPAGNRAGHPPYPPALSSAHSTQPGAASGRHEQGDL